MLLSVFIHFSALNVPKNCTIKLYLTKVFINIHQYTFIKTAHFHNFLPTKTPIKIIFGLIYRLLCNIYKKTKTPKTMKVLNNGHFGRFFVTFLGTIKMPKNCPFCKNFLCNILLHMQRDLYIIYSNLCTLYANKTPSFCPPEKNGPRTQSKRLRFDFSPARYKYTRSLVSAFCIFIRL